MNPADRVRMVQAHLADVLAEIKAGELHGALAAASRARLNLEGIAFDLVEAFAADLQAVPA